MPRDENFPATKFLVELFRASPERMRVMDTAAVAKHYGLDEQWVTFCRNRELEHRS